MVTRKLYAVLEWIPAAMLVQFAHWTSSLVVRLFPYRAFSGGNLQYFPDEFRFHLVFCIFLGLQHLFV